MYSYYEIAFLPQNFPENSFMVNAVSKNGCFWTFIIDDFYSFGSPLKSVLEKKEFLCCKELLQFFWRELLFVFW